MRNVLTLSWQVIRDAARRKIFYVVFLFGIAVIALSPLLPTFELGLKAQFLRDVSLSLTSLFAVVLAVIISVGQISSEIDRKTVYNVLSKPVSRFEYLLGKYIGVLASLAAILFVMGLEILLLIYFRVSVFTPIIFEGIFAIFLEAAVISAFCICLSTMTSVPVNILSVILFYLVTHLKTGFLHQQLIQGVKGVAKVFSWAVYYLIPNLENFNISQSVGYSRGPGWIYMLRITGYALLFMAILFGIGLLLFRRRDL
jgi:ABC-type transport system involved in multi-copper enzyme maturation permease subunit